MRLLPLERLGARSRGTSPEVFDFRVLLPWVYARDGNRLFVKIIHEKDQFIQDVQPLEFEMDQSEDPDYGALWSAEVEIDPDSGDRHPDSHFGEDGRYVYRYQLESPLLEGPIDWIVDPFAREFGVGKLSAITKGYDRDYRYRWSDDEEGWKTPPLDELIVYELMINEFGGSIGDAIDRLDYLQDLGINCVEVMPVSNVSNTVDWGFLPIGYFGVDERFGKRCHMQRFVDAAHRRGIAVILDVVYGHTSDQFPYCYLYDRLHYTENPFMGPFAKDYFGRSTDFNRLITQDFFFTVNYHWLEVYHVDGFRYDCVPNYWDGPVGRGYASLVYETYNLVKAKADDWRRFFDGGSINLIQCAEQLEGPRDVLWETYSNCTWQNETLDAAKKVARGNDGWLTALGFCLGLMDYPTEVLANGDAIRKTALQYLENHDHPRLVCNFGTLPKGIDESLRLLRERNPDLCGAIGPDLLPLKDGDRGLWYKVQPYLIGIFAAKGIPMIWQGQEFGENYFIPERGMGRVILFRPVRWDYFYDPVGKRMVSLVRRLIKMRRSPQFQRGRHHFINDGYRYQSRGLLLFSREDGERYSLVALNFTDRDQEVEFQFPFGGDYREELHAIDDLEDVVAGRWTSILVPSNYGRVWTVSK
ncbi:MAG: Malto-oligosyltrehalose trehalohydrolase [Methanosaeta sp. PtaU1.Bin055]|nr:MAG: Malto-oligosyltrehalose trehalohydrolase [Methanosaeta sp. PtaU1.Bin055]